MGHGSAATTVHAQQVRVWPPSTAQNPTAQQTVGMAAGHVCGSRCLQMTPTHITTINTRTIASRVRMVSAPTGRLARGPALLALQPSDCCWGYVCVHVCVCVGTVAARH